MIPIVCQRNHPHQYPWKRLSNVHVKSSKSSYNYIYQSESLAVRLIKSIPTGQKPFLSWSSERCFAYPTLDFDASMGFKCVSLAAVS